MVTKITRRGTLLLGAGGTAALAFYTSDDGSTEESQSQSSNVLIIESDEQYTIQKDSSESYSAVKVYGDGMLHLERNAALRLTNPSE